MKPLAYAVLVLVLCSSVGVVVGDVPRHVDPAQYELVEPDPEVLFMLYHNMFEGMILENMTVQAEWLDMIGEVYSVDELAPMLELYGDQITVQAGNLNLTRYHLDQAIRYIGEYNLSAARSSFFTGLGHLQDSNETIPVLRGTTVDLGEAVRSNPELLLGDLDQLQGLVDGYRDFAQLLADFMSGEELSVDDVAEIKAGFEGVVDPDVLDQIEDYLDELEGGLTVDELVRTSLSLGVEPEVVWVGDVVRLSGRLSGGGVGLGGRRLVFRVGEYSKEVVTGLDGYYSVGLSVPFIYESSLEVRGFYWPSGVDASVYSPATAVKVMELLFNVPRLELDYDSVAYPGRLWNVSGRLLGMGGGLEGFLVDVSGFGESLRVVSGAGGVFEGSLLVPFGYGSGVVDAIVSVQPSGVYSGVSMVVMVDVVRLPLVFDVSKSGVLFSGSSALFMYSVVSDGVELDRCRVEAIGEDGRSVDYSLGGDGFVQVFIPLWRVSGVYDVKLVADPFEPWITGATVTRSFYVVNSMFAIFLGLSVIGAGLLLNRYYDKKPVDSFEESVQVLEPVSIPVDEVSVVTGAHSFSGLFLVALRIVERLTGVVMKPSDTLREYLGRVADGLGDRIGGLFRELVTRYERWLYGRPHESELERVEVLVAGLEEEDEV